MRAARACLVIGLAFSVGSVRARADDASLGDKAAARDLFTDGIALRAKGDLTGALVKFKGAYSLWPSATTGLELGRTHMQLGELIEARERLLETVKIPKKPGETSASQNAREEAQKLADSLAPRIPMLVFKISGAPAAKVALDGRELPSEALGSPRKVNPGKHTVMARAPGTADLNVEVTVEEGQTREVPLVFAMPAKTTTSEPTPAPVVDTAPVVDAAPVAPSSTTSPLVYVGFGVAGVGIVVGGITGALAMSSASSLKTSCTDGRCPPAAHDDVDAYQRWGTISTISFIAAGAGAAVGIYGWLSSPVSGPRKEAHAHVTPWIGIGSAGLAGAF